MPHRLLTFKGGFERYGLLTSDHLTTIDWQPMPAAKFRVFRYTFSYVAATANCRAHIRSFMQ